MCIESINKPTREVKNSKSIIDNIFSNVPYALDLCDVGIIRTYISDHHAILCVLDTVIPVPQHNNKQNTVIKINLCDRNVAQFICYLTNEKWGIIYEENAQKTFMWFQELINLFFNKCFPRQSHILTYRNRYRWMPNKLRTQISEKNRLGYQAFCNPENLNLKNEYKQRKIVLSLICEMQNLSILAMNLIFIKMM